MTNISFSFLFLFLNSGEYVKLFSVIPGKWLMTKMKFMAGAGGDLRVYLEGLAMAENVQEYVKQNPFGQRAITQTSENWEFYQRVINSLGSLPTRRWMWLSILLWVCTIHYWERERESFIWRFESCGACFHYFGEHASIFLNAVFFFWKTV